ncbi:MAG: hypothetical protein QNJ90_16070 [Planctomycetota bacterium]|nr:hypothetical protein [Planctomycetota bacterium]
MRSFVLDSATVGLLLILAAGLAGCGEPRPVEQLDRTPRSHLSGIESDDPVPGKPGHYQKHLLTRGYKLDPWDVNIHTEPYRIGLFGRGKKVWITNWFSNTEDTEGNREPDDIHCHAILADQVTYANDELLFTGIFTDGFTPHMRMPEGFGIPVEAGQRLLFQPMFNNRRPKGRVSRMRLNIDYVVEGATEKPLKELRAYALRGAPRDLYWVEPGKIDTRTRVVEVPFQGRVHAIGGHLHPYGEFIEMRRHGTDELIFRAEMRKADKLEDMRLDTYCDPVGFFIRRGEKLHITTVYDNKSDQKIDAMGGLLLLYDPAGKPDA